jgi:hypothetical protein
VAAAWPDDDRPAATASSAPSTTLMTKDVADAFEPTRPTAGSIGETPTTVAPARLFQGALFELVIYPDRLSAAFVPPAHPDVIDEVTWSAGMTSPAKPNVIDDRVDDGTAPKLFDRSDVDLGLIAGLVADAPSRYDVPVTVTHVIIDRFLPFDHRVLIRVYATPDDGRSGGGYVSYQATDGAYVATCC